MITSDKYETAINTDNFVGSNAINKTLSEDECNRSSIDSNTLNVMIHNWI